jgi:hypothetical protein
VGNCQIGKSGGYLPKDWSGTECVPASCDRPPATHAAASQPEGSDDVGTDDAAGGCLASKTDYPPSLAEPSLCRRTPEVGAVCGKAARTVLCGGRAMKRASLPLELDIPFMDTKGPLQLKPPAILAVATLERTFGVGPAEVFRSRRGVGYCPLAFKRRGTVVADGHFYVAAVRLMKRIHHSPPLGGKKQVGLPSKANSTASPVGECSSHQITSGGTSTHWPSF